MTTAEIASQFKFTAPQLLQMLIASVSNDDPLEILDQEYGPINPGMLEKAINLGKAEFAKLNKKDAKKINCYLTIGGDSYNRSFWNGVIAAILCIQDIMDIAKFNHNVSEEDVQTAKSVLAKINVPRITDITVEDTNIKAISNCRHYASFLGTVAHWCTTGLSKIHTSGAAHTNMEAVRLLTASAMNQLPSVPFAAYFIGQIKNNNIYEVAEHMSSIINFSDHMSPESILINQPQFVVQTENAPIVGVVGHPLVNTAVGQKSPNGGFEWLGLFESNPEFDKLCLADGLTSQQVKKYLFQIDKERHEAAVARKDKVALFVERQHLAKQALELHSSKLVK